jgi:pimeloyl-ACP methyl ester carboxylesterase
LLANSAISVPTAYDPEPYVITRRLIESGRKYLLLRAPLAINGPVRLLHGLRDPDVPWQTALRLAAVLTSKDVRVTLIKDGEHRLSRESDLAVLEQIVRELIE